MPIQKKCRESNEKITSENAKISVWRDFFHDKIDGRISVQMRLQEHKATET